MGNETGVGPEDPADAPVSSGAGAAGALGPEGRCGVRFRASTVRLLDAIYREHAGYVRWLLARSDVHPDAADALHARAFVRLGLRIEAGTVVAEPRATLCRIAKHLICNHLRSSREALDELDGSDVDALPVSQRDVEQVVIGAEDARLVRDVLEKMPQSKSELLLKALEGRTAEEIAAAENKPAGTIRSKLSRARELFRATYKALLAGVLVVLVVAAVVAMMRRATVPAPEAKRETPAVESASTAVAPTALLVREARPAVEPTATAEPSSPARKVVTPAPPRRPKAPEKKGPPPSSLRF